MDQAGNYISTHRPAHEIAFRIITDGAASCPVAVHYEASQHVGGDEYERLVKAANSLTPLSLDGAHRQLVDADIAIDEFALDLDALTLAETLERLAKIKAAIGRLLQFTTAATGLPGSRSQLRRSVTHPRPSRQARASARLFEGLDSARATHAIRGMRSGMDAESVLTDLAIVNCHVAMGARHLAEQVARIEKLERGGHQAQGARELLVLLEDIQRLHVEHQDRLMRDLRNANRT